jgi:hypothetical protein
MIAVPVVAGRARDGSREVVAVSLAQMFLVALLLLMPVVPSDAADQKASAPQEASALASAPLPSPVIPLAQVASRAMEVEALLRASRTLQAGTSATSMIEQQLPEASALIGIELERTLRLLQERPPLETLEVKQELWAKRQFLTTTWLDALTRRVTELQEALTRLANLHQTWTLNQDAARAARAPEPMLGQIAEVLSAIEAAETPLEAQRAVALDLQSRVAREVARCQSALAQVAEAQRQAVGGLLETGHPPIWNARWWMGARPVDVSNVREIAAGWWREVVQELRDPATGVRTHVALFVALAALLWAARRRTPEVNVPNAQLVTERVTNCERRLLHGGAHAVGHDESEPIPSTRGQCGHVGALVRSPENTSATRMERRRRIADVALQPITARRAG